MAEVHVFTPEFRKICDGLLGAEGPVFDKKGNMFMVAPEVEDADGKSAGEVLSVNLQDGTVSKWCCPVIDGSGGIPAGCQVDKDNRLWVADMRLGLLQITASGDGSSGVHKQVVSECEGKPMQGCNDCAFDSYGNLWITAPAGPIAPAPYTRSMEEPFGSVYCHTNKGETMLIDTGYRFSNGIAVTKDSSTLIVAETPTKSLWAYDITGPGTVANKKLWGKLPGDHEGGPDGMDFDEKGYLLVANWGSGHLEVFDSTGKLTGRIKCPFSKPSNLHFKPNSSEVFVTEHEFHGLWQFNWSCKGQKQYCEL